MQFIQGQYRQQTYFATLEDQVTVWSISVRGDTNLSGEMDCNDSIIYYTTLREKVKRYNVVTQ